MELILLLLLLIGLYLFYTSNETLCNCESFTIETNDIRNQNHTRYKSLIFGENLKFTNSILT